MLIYVRAHAQVVYARLVTAQQPLGSRALRSPGVRAWGALLRTHAALVPKLDRDLQTATGLPLPWYDVLLELNSAQECRLLMSELGARVVLSRTRVSRVVDELEAAGLVTRRSHESDRRATYAVLTPAGRRRFRAAAPVYLRGIADHFARHMNATELATMATGLERVLGRERP